MWLEYRLDRRATGARRVQPTTSSTSTPTDTPCRLEPLEGRRMLAVGGPDGSFSIVVMPDTQVYAEKYPEIFNSQTQWIRDNAAAQNIAFVTHVGDVVENASSATEWQRADAAMDKLHGVVPYSVAIGNHDYDPMNDRSKPGNFVQWFGASRYAGQSWYGGASQNQVNHYQIFEAGPWRFMHVTVQWEATDADLAWAQGVIDAHPGLPILFTTHQYLTGSGTRTTSASAGGNSGEAMWQELIRKNPRIFMVHSGHYTAEQRLVSQNDAGQDVHQILVDHQGRTMGGEGYLRVLKFLPQQNKVEVTSYSPYRNANETDANSQFTLNIDFATRFPPRPGTSVVRYNEVLVPGSSKVPPATPAPTPTAARRAPVARPTPFATRRVELWDGEASEQRVETSERPAIPARRVAAR